MYLHTPEHPSIVAAICILGELGAAATIGTSESGNGDEGGGGGCRMSRIVGVVAGHSLESKHLG